MVRRLGYVQLAGCCAGVHALANGPFPRGHIPSCSRLVKGAVAWLWQAFRKRNRRHVWILTRTQQTPACAVRPLRHCVNGGIARIELATAIFSGDQPWLRYGVLLLEFPVNGDCLRQSVGQFQGGFSAYHSTRELIRIQDVRPLQARIIFTASAVTAPTKWWMVGGL